MNNQPDLSVVIPVYNKRPHLLRSVTSVLNQSHRNFELILVDDGSTDRSLDAVEHLNDPRIRRIRQENAGVSAARNTGIQLANAPLIAFLDADDTWEPGFLNAMLTLATIFPEAGIYASGYSIKSPNEAAKPAPVTGMPWFRQRFLSRSYFRMSAGGELPITASSVVIPRDILLSLGGFPAGEKMGEDQHVWWQICAHHPFAYDRRRLATYHRDATERACPANVPDNELPFSSDLNNALSTLQLSVRERVHARRYMGAHLLYLVRENTRAGRLDVAQRLLSDRRTHLLPLKRIVRQLEIMRECLNPEKTPA